MVRATRLHVVYTIRYTELTTLTAYQLQEKIMVSTEKEWNFPLSQYKMKSSTMTKYNNCTWKWRETFNQLAARFIKLAINSIMESFLVELSSEYTFILITLMTTS